MIGIGGGVTQVFPVLFDYAPGLAGYTFARGSVAHQRRQDLTLQQVANHVLRDAHYETDPIGGGLIRTALLEGQRTNHDPDSDYYPSHPNVADATNPIGAAAVNRQDTANNTRTLRSSGVFQNVEHVLSAWVKAEVESEQVRLVLMIDDGAFDHFGSLYYVATTDTLTSSTNGSFTVSRAGREIGPNGWTRIWIAGYCTVASNAVRRYIYRAQNGTLAPVRYCGFQLEQAGFPSSYTRTSASTATRAAEAPYFDIGFGPQPLTVWWDAIAQPAGNTGAALRLWSLGDALGTTTQGVDLSYDGASATNIIAKVRASGGVNHFRGFDRPLDLASYPRIRGRIVIRASEMQLYSMVNGETAETASGVSSITLPTEFTGGRVRLNAAFDGSSVGFQALRRLTIAPGERDAAFFLARGN
jgi:hypothetical protein